MLINLNGKWSVYDCLNEYTLEGSVPGCIHNDMMDAGLMEDYNFRTNELDCQWIGERGWIYERTFVVDSKILENTNVQLCCLGLDTIATIYINNTLVNKTMNMFREYEFDVKTLLVVGENTIRIEFESASVYCREKNKVDYMHSWNKFLGQDGRGWLRKAGYSFGWDWAPVLATCGIWKSIFIEGFEQKLSRPVLNHKLNDALNNAQVHIAGQCKGNNAKEVRVELSYNNEIIHESVVAVDSNGHYDCAFNVENPLLWWPNLMGEQPLYSVVLELVNEKGEVTDGTSMRLGFRKMEVLNEKDKYGESFCFSVNNTPFFAKGAAWIPEKVLPSLTLREDVKPLLEQAIAANYNMLRVWGGAYFPGNDFFDLCDEMGIVLWQDYLFACGMYPAHDKNFMAEVEAEVESNLPRIGYHACIGLMCGNNEIYEAFRNETRDNEHMSNADYDALFNDLLPRLTKQYMPNTYYWPCSPTPGVCETIDGKQGESGDTHLWEIWFSESPFERYRAYNTRFVSEFGFQAFPQRDTIDSFTLAEDIQYSSPVLEHRQKSEPGNFRIMCMVMKRFRFDGDFNNFIKLSQLVQATAVQIGVEHFRQNRDVTAGALYWNLNDVWPASTWASIDYYGNWKALHYFAKRFFAPVFISGSLDDNNNLSVFVNNDLLKEVSGKAIVKLCAVNGENVFETEIDATLKPNSAEKIAQIQLTEYVSELLEGEYIIFLDFISSSADKNSVTNSLECRCNENSSNILLPTLPKQIALENPELSYAIFETEPNTYLLHISGYAPSLWTNVEVTGIECTYSDNYKSLQPGEIWDVTLRTKEESSIEDIVDALNVTSLWDTYNKEV